MLIVLKGSAKAQLEGYGLDEDGLQKHLDSLDGIQLFKGRDKKNPKALVIVLPIGDNKHALLCKYETAKRDDEKDYLVCYGIINTFIDADTSGKFRHELPPNVTCRIIEKDAYGYHAPESFPCREICDEVRLKKVYRLDNEERKWRTYFDIFRKILEDKVVDFSALVKELTAKKLTAVLNTDGVDSPASDAALMY